MHDYGDDNDDDDQEQEAAFAPAYQPDIRDYPAYLRGQIAIRAGILVIVTALLNEPTIKSLPILQQIASFTQSPVRDIMAAIALMACNERAQYADKPGMKREVRTWTMSYIVYLALVSGFLYALSLRK
jgi:hypothetical protein